MIRITELRMRMPISARMPRMATKPIGELLASSAMTTPMMASGATAKTRNSRWKDCNWIIKIVAMMNSISGSHGGDRALRLGAFLDRAADLDVIAGRQGRVEFLQPRAPVG